MGTRTNTWDDLSGHHLLLLCITTTTLLALGGGQALDVWFIICLTRPGKDGRSARLSSAHHTYSHLTFDIQTRPLRTFLPLTWPRKSIHPIPCTHAGRPIASLGAEADRPESEAVASPIGQG